MVFEMPRQLRAPKAEPSDASIQVPEREELRRWLRLLRRYVCATIVDLDRYNWRNNENILVLKIKRCKAHWLYAPCALLHFIAWARSNALDSYVDESSKALYLRLGRLSV